ncbi:MAG: MBL fold metallo-hydrolase [Actinomycetota bacterium]|nr:MBL fold metallo-hydrolase [Actinomycetota bacterium]
MLLGTAGGPLPSPVRSGIATAVVVGGRVLLVDCGSGVTRQLRRARLLSSLRMVFLTHLHSDHDCDYFNLFLLGWPVLQWNPPVPVYGPGPAGGPAALPADPPGRPPVPVVHPAKPTPGLVEVTAAHVRAHAYDMNVRMREAGRADLTSLIVPHEIAVPATVGARPPDRVAPPMAPLVVVDDGDVRVSAVLVQHPPVFPAFAYRVDTPAGSVVVSGDTAPCENLVRLAAGADVLVHEVFDDAALGQRDEDEDDDWEAEQREHHLRTSHTRLSRVGSVAGEAGVGRLVLTHFIPGDDALPDDVWVKGASAGFDGEVVVGHDLLELTL